MRWVHGLSTLVVWLGVLAGFWGVAYAVNGGTQPEVRAPVTLVDDDHSGWGDQTIEISGVDPGEVDGIGVRFVGARPGGWVTAFAGMVTGPDGTVTVVAWGSSHVEGFLARGNFAVLGLGALVGALALAPVLRTIAEGRPFAPGNARRLTVLGVTVAVAGAVAPMLPAIAGFMVLERTGLAGPRFASETGPALTPILVGALVLALAAAFQIGERMTDDVRGLV